MSNIVNERSTAFLTVSLEDKDGVPSAPLSATLTIRDLKTNTIMRPETALTVTGATINIVIQPNENRLLGTGPEEKRRLTLRAAYGVGDEFTDSYDFKVRKVT